ncbi:ribosome recycling factor [Candidatus Uhrbacteria bacterium]|jgi:ribosome recycling factor|nr:ribosome recycling factor [Candidatus Uhrbacteria bacterium]
MHHFLADKKPEFEKVVEFLSSELLGVRTGRAATSLVEGIKVTAYDQEQELKNLAAISTPDSVTIQIEPWDASVVKDIEKALNEADLGMAPNVAGKTIRLNVPPLTEDTRKNLVKVIGQRVESARISVRNVRDEMRKEVERLEKEKEIGEDERYQIQEEIDVITKETNDKLDQLGKDKETQVMTV